jgi:acyl-CoA reductase-like NAD-dependent aldehyde dehydrogenase
MATATRARTAPPPPGRSRLFLANGVRYGLTSSGWIDTHVPIVAEMPHGGFKQSGHDKDLSMYGFEDYTRTKHMMSNVEL